jgi:hypothetical protein
LDLQTFEPRAQRHLREVVNVRNGFFDERDRFSEPPHLLKDIGAQEQRVVPSQGVLAFQLERSLGHDECFFALRTLSLEQVFGQTRKVPDEHVPFLVRFVFRDLRPPVPLDVILRILLHG